MRRLGNDLRPDVAPLEDAPRQRAQLAAAYRRAGAGRRESPRRPRRTSRSPGSGSPSRRPRPSGRSASRGAPGDGDVARSAMETTAPGSAIGRAIPCALRGEPHRPVHRSRVEIRDAEARGDRLPTVDFPTPDGPSMATIIARAISSFRPACRPSWRDRPSPRVTFTQAFPTDAPFLGSRPEELHLRRGGLPPPR